MKRLDIYDVKQLDYYSKDDLMEYQSLGVVRSKKLFPIYGNKIFKPLSKTKPLTTPLFAYSEVFWSYYINKYFEEKAPRYYLAKCDGIENEISKYYSIGTLVQKVTKEDEELANLLEYFRENPDNNVNIDNYVNYCEKIYDYSDILKSKIFEERTDLRHSLEKQILLSILKRDENFHYENVSFIVKDNEILNLCPSLDSEFSLMFMYPDQQRKKVIQKCRYERSLNIPFDKKGQEFIIGEWLEDVSWKVSLNNIIAIVKQDTEVIREFSNKLDLFIEDIEETDILFYNDDFFEGLNSDAWKIGHARYKDQNEEKAKELEKSIIYKSLDEKEFNINLKDDCLDSAKSLKFILQVLLVLQEYNALDEVTIQNYLRIIDKEMTKEEFYSLSLDEKLELGNKQKTKTFSNN